MSSPCRSGFSGTPDDLSGGSEPGDEAEEQHRVAAAHLPSLEQSGEREREGRGARVAAVDNVARDDDVRRELEGAHQGLRDAKVRLMRDDGGDVRQVKAGLFERAAGEGGVSRRGPAVDG